MLNRITPAMDAANYKTYQIAAPLSTHFRPASCVEVDCPDHLNGWRVRKALISEHAMADINTARYAFIEVDFDGEPFLVFEAGQPCFRASEHRVPLEREPLYLVRGGDFRGNPRGEQLTHTRPEDWVDDFANHQQSLADRMEQG